MSPSPLDGDFSSLFNFLPIGAYRASPSGQMLRANQALVRLNGYASEAEMLEGVKDVAREWYVEPERRAQFQQQLERDGYVRGFISEIHRYKTRERVWISENAHGVRDASGELLYYEGTVEDITDRVNDQKALRESEEQLRGITSQIPGMVFSVFVRPDGQREYRFVSSGVRDIYGLEPEDLMRDPTLVARYRHPDDLQLLEQDLEHIRKGPVDLGGEFRIVLPDGRVKWVYRRSYAVSASQEGTLRVGVLLDITARKEAEAALHANEALWRLALEGAGDGVWDWDLRTGEEFFSRSIKAMFGYDEDDIAHFAVEMDARTHPDDVAQMRADRQAHFEMRTPTYRNEHRVRCKDGSWKWVLTRGTVIVRDENGTPLRMVGTHTDITEHKKNLEQIHQLAYYDALTGLPNRQHFNELLTRRLESAADREGGHVFFIEVLGLRQVNDRFGHEAADRLFAETVRQLSATIADLTADAENETGATPVLARFAGRPPRVAVRILDAPPLPGVSLSPDRTTMLLMHGRSLPSIECASMPKRRWPRPIRSSVMSGSAR